MGLGWRLLAVMATPPTDPVSKPRRRFGPGCIAIVSAVGLLVFIGLATPTHCPNGNNARLVQASNNARDVIATMKTALPQVLPADPAATANAVFRTLIRAGYVEDERIFSAPLSPYQPDNDLGEAPDYARALEPDEVHWCLFQSEPGSQQSGNLPLVFDNPIDGTWPPKWNPKAEGKPLPGRPLKGGIILFGLSDGSITPVKLVSSADGLTTLDPASLERIRSKRFHDIER